MITTHLKKTEQSGHKPKQSHKLYSAVVRFCGDSGDGMQLSGTQFSNTSGIFGNDLMTFPDFPAEIRAPQGSLPGVSGFQVHFASSDIYAAGDEVDVLVAMNSATLKTNPKDLRRGGVLIVNSSAFNERNLRKASYTHNPLGEEEIDNNTTDKDTSFLNEDTKLLKEKYKLIKVPISQITLDALADIKELKHSQAERCKNFFALGIVYWLFGREIEYSQKWIAQKFKGKELLIQANQKALKSGYYFAETSELTDFQFEVTKANLTPGLYRSINGANATVLGLVSASKKANLPLFYAGHPITPASEILHGMARYKLAHVTTFQAEDEIAAASAAIGASYGGAIGITASSGPGIMLKAEAINLAVMTELPLVIINAQRGGPSTGLPTKSEQSDLFFTLFGRSGESPIPVVAPYSPSDSFTMIIEAVRFALAYMTPVFFLSDLYNIMGTEPWLLPNIEKLPEIKHNLFAQEKANIEDAKNFHPYQRDAKTLVRPWVVPGTPHYEHRIGGLEKDAKNSNVSYNPENHELMVKMRANKVAQIANTIPLQEVFGAKKGKVLVLGWGSTFGAIREAVLSLQEAGHEVAQTHLRYINPLPSNLKEILSNYENILIPEINLGQLAFYLKATLNLGDAIKIKQMNHVRGLPLPVAEITARIQELL